MTKRATAVTLLLTVFMTLLVFAPAVCSAAAADKPSQVKVQVIVNEPKPFWSYPYITREDGKIRMPAAVMVEWSTTNGLNSNKGQVLQAGDKRGEYVITTDRNTYVDIEIQVVDSDKKILGKGGMQVRNTGQTVIFYVYLPDSTSPSVITE